MNRPCSPSGNAPLLRLALVVLGATLASLPAIAAARATADSSAPAASVAADRLLVDRSWQQSDTSEQESDGHVWKSPNGRPLPFQTDPELLDFLSTATVVSVEKIPEGVTKPRQVLLEKDGVQAHAVYHDIDETHSRVRLTDGSFYMSLRDSAAAQCASYEIARMLGLDNVPPTVMRRIQSQPGSLQLWVENTMTEGERAAEGLRPPNRLRQMREASTMYVFDALVGNVDRNAGNVLYDRDTWKLWMVDHTRAFQVTRQPWDVSKIMWCERGLWERLQTLDATEVKDRLQKLVSGMEVDSMFKRRDQLIEHIQGLINERGEGAVLFNAQ